MNKKEARRRKHELEKKKQEILDSRIIGDQEEETLLGNLADVHQIAMIPWDKIPEMTTYKGTLHIPPEKNGEWLEKLFRDTMADEKCDLIGFTPVTNFDDPIFDEIGPGSVGSALQIKKVEKAVNGALLISVLGICRYENTGFLEPTGKYFNIKVRWFEDEPEPDAVVKPEFQRYLKTLERVSKIAGERMKEYHYVSKRVPYHWRSAYFSSFLLIKDSVGWFTPQEKIELFRMTSTLRRMKTINDKADQILPYIELRERQKKKSWFN